MGNRETLFNHFRFPVLKGRYSLTGFLHIFKSGISKRIPSIELKIEDLIIVESVVLIWELKLTGP